jgi:ABC-2 type transport system permease protein
VRSAWFVARTDVAHLLRARETIIWTFVMPIVFFYFIGTITGGSSSLQGSAEHPDPIAVEATAGSGFLVDELARRLEQQHFKVERPATDAELERFSRRLELPRPASGRSLTEAVLAGERLTITFRSRAEGPGANFDRVRIARAVYGLVADLAVTKSRGETTDPAAFARLQAEPRGITLEVVSAGRRRQIPSGFEQAIPGSMVMFTMLVLLTSGAILLVIEREQGLLRRLASTPIPRWALVTGKWAGRLALGLLQIGFAMLAGTLLFKMRWGGALPMITLVMFAWASFNASLGILLGNFARSRAQMVGIGVLSTNVLAGLGGCWWPIEITPAWMQTLARFLPTGWAMDALHKLISFGYEAPAAIPHVLGLSAAAFVVGVFAVRTFRYQ